MKIEIKGEQPPEQERTVNLGLRRYRGAGSEYKNQTVFMTADDGVTGIEVFPIRIDGNTKEFSVRRRTIENLGFRFVLEKDK